MLASAFWDAQNPCWAARIPSSSSSLVKPAVLSRTPAEVSKTLLGCSHPARLSKTSTTNRCICSNERVQSSPRRSVFTSKKYTGQTDPSAGHSNIRMKGFAHQPASRASLHLACFHRRSVCFACSGVGCFSIVPRRYSYNILLLEYHHKETPGTHTQTHTWHVLFATIVAENYRSKSII